MNNNLQSKRFEGRLAMITGACSGIGLECARRLAAEGAIVAGLDLAVSSAWEQLPTPAGKLFFEADVRSADQQAAAVAQILSTHQAIDILVTAAGVAGGGPVHELAVEEWDRVVDINLKGTFLSCRAVLGQMLKQGGGNIVTIASIEGIEGTEGGTCYNASKGGVILLTRCMAIDYGRRNIRANAICPGFIETPLMKDVLEGETLREFRDTIREHHKLGRWGQPQEIAAAAAFLASDDASFITGQAIPVDGGFTSGHSSGLLKMMGLD